MILVKHYHVTVEDDDDKPFKTSCKRSNLFIIFSVKIQELLYINFLRAGMSTIGLNPEELVPELLFFD